MQKIIFFLYLLFLSFKPNFIKPNSSLSFVRLSWDRIMDNLQLTGKISLELDSNSSFLLEYGC